MSTSKIHIIGVPEKDKKEMSRKVFEGTITKNFPNLMKTFICIFTQQIPSRINANRSTSRHITVKMLKAKDEERIPNAARENSAR